MKKSLFVPFAFCLLPVIMPLSSSSWAVSPRPCVFAQAPDNPNAEAESLLVQGVEQLDANQFDKALQSFQQTLAIQRRIGNRFGEAIALNNLGVVYYYQGQYEQAIALQQESIQILWKLYESPDDDHTNSRAGIAVALNNQSLAYRQLEQYQKAIELCHGAIGIFRNLGDRTREAATLNNIGVAYEAIGEYQRAIGYFQEALATTQGNSDVRGEVITLSNIGEAYSKLGESAQAVKFERQARSMAQSISEDVGIGGISSTYDYLLVRQNQRSLVIVFSPVETTIEAAPQSP